LSTSRTTLSIVTVVLLLGVMTAAGYWRTQANAPADEVAAGALNGQVPEGDGPQTTASQQFSTATATPVVGAEVVVDTLWITVAADGRAAAIREAIVTAQVEGQITALQVRENSSVGRGTVVVQIDSATYALEVRSQQAQLLTAEADYRTLTVFDAETVMDPEVLATRDKMARARSGVDQGEARLATAQLNLDRSRVKAPFAGRVANVEIVVGQYVRVGDPLLTIVALNPIKVEANVLEKDLGLLTEGRRASVDFAALPGLTYEARIETINPIVDPETGAARVTLHVNNGDRRIRPGMYARVTLEAEAIPDRTLVPRSAILERGDGRRRTMLFVYGADGDVGRAEWRYVTTGRENETLVEILENSETSMVETGEVVLVDGHQYLIHDALVRTVEALAPGEGRPGR
jgi:membrane fusion protein (multidrug efflux system)